MSTLTVTTIQADLRWEDKAANLRHLDEKIRGLGGSTELVLLPEMFSTGFSMDPGALAEKMDGAGVDWMRRIAAREKVILCGSLIIEEGGAYFNRLIWMLPNGQYGTYDKRHRFALAGEDAQYTAGQKRLIGSVKGWRVLPLVCYDLRFPVWSRQNPEAGGKGGRRKDVDPGALEVRGSGDTDAAAEYDLLIYVANWPERRNRAWKTLLPARAIENQSYVVGINRVGTDGNGVFYSGDSMIIDPLGEVLYQGSKEEVNTYTLQKEKLEEVRSQFPFWRDADHFSIEL